MPGRIRLLLSALLSMTLATPAFAGGEFPPIKAFARIPKIRNVAVSPDGQRLLYITSSDDFEVAVTLSSTLDKPVQPIIRSEPGEFELQWCGWANNERVLCGVSATMREGSMLYGISRLVAVNADGSEQKLLMQNTAGRAQFQDEILDWTPDEPDTVLLELDAESTGYPGIYELNVHTGRKALRSRGHHPIRNFSTDGAGNVRLGYGYSSNSTVVQYFARLDNEKKWLPLLKIKAFESSDALVPLAVIPGTNRAFASGSYEGRSALWEMDLTDQAEPKLVFSHPLVDAASPLLTPDRQLIGISYETDRPFVHYTDEETRGLMGLINKALPSTFNYISDYSQDRKVYIVSASSDVEANTYYLLRTDTNKLLRIATAYPELDPKTLGRMRTIAYQARDGVEIPGYLTVPAGVRAEKLPLIVMPHGGPISRDSWEFFFLREFLVSRGYGVLQMNFRGSSGYGWEWFVAAHQDWGGLTYTDITDGAKWAIQQGIADPKRVCIVGWSFGGYAALLGAVRNPDLYRCSASIAGVSDLKDLLDDSSYFSNRAFVREQIGSVKDKLREDSPLRHARNINMPVFLIHGDRDIQVDVGHTRQMASALKSADKPYQSIILKNATHQLRRQSDRITLLTELEKFLLQHLGPGTVSGGGTS